MPADLRFYQNLMLTIKKAQLTPLL